MDQKRAMLYPDIDIYNERSVHQRNTASASIGLPVESPPSYDDAISTGVRDSVVGPNPSAPPASPSQAQGNSDMNFMPALPVIVEQPIPTVVTTMPQPQPQPQVITLSPPITASSSPTLVAGTKLGPNPCTVLCPSCGAQKTTRMTFTPNSRTHLGAFLLCLVGWCCCACCVPYCMNSCRTGNHYCSKCNTFLGTFNPKRHK